MSEDQNVVRVFSIKNVSEQLEIPQGTLRQWEKDFELKIPRTSNNVRYYTMNEINLFQKIKNLRDKGSSVDMIRQLLKGTAPRAALMPPKSEPTIAEVIRSIENLKKQFLTLQDHLEKLPEVVKTAVAEEVKKELEAGNKQLQAHLASVVREQLAEGIQRELSPGTHQAYVASSPTPEKRKKSIWRKDPRNMKKAGRT